MILHDLLALAAAVGAQAPAAPEADGRIFTVSGYVGRWDEEGDAWFRIDGYDLQLMLPGGAERETFWQLLTAASEAGVALQVRIDAVAGRIAVEGNRVVYPVCSLRTPTGASFGDEARNCPPGSAAASEPERLVALGLAQVEQNRDQARRLLEEALDATPALPPLIRAIAHKERANLSELLSLELAPGLARDRLLADSLADWRRLAALLPERPGPHIHIAEALIDLGDYGEAEQVLLETGRRWPDAAHEVAIALGALYRQQGRYRRALRQLDDHARRHPEVSGMRFHYHRAWTLMLLGRHREALRDVDVGLMSQPDYASAYGLRSCLLARLGRLEAAAADQERAAELYDVRAEASAYSRGLAQRSRDSAAALRRAAAAGRTGRMSGPCADFFGEYSRPRPRSALLTAN